MNCVCVCLAGRYLLHQSDTARQHLTESFKLNLKAVQLNIRPPAEYLQSDLNSVQHGLPHCVQSLSGLIHDGEDSVTSPPLGLFAVRGPLLKCLNQQFPTA